MRNAPSRADIACWRRVRHIANMRKFFNISGPCNPEEHYMLPAQERLTELRQLIDQKQFFVIHAARQSGKTTLLRELVRHLNAEGEYHALYCSLEAVQGITAPEIGIPTIVQILANAVSFAPRLQDHPFETDPDQPFATVLRHSLNLYCAKLKRPLILMLDEVDCLANGTLISFLRQLRDGYVNRSDIPFVHSLALVGMRNIRDYTAKVREDATTLGSASPFNIIKRALTLRNFSAAEVTALYAQHAEATGQAFPPAATARAYAFTRGQPWLVNALACEVVEQVLKNDTFRPIIAAHVDQAAETIIQRRDTHIDSLLERLKEERVRRIVEPMLLGKELAIDYLADDCQYCLDLGLIENDRGVLQPANLIYGEVIARTLSYNAQYSLTTDYINRWMTNDAIDMNALLREFQVFWRENSDMWVERFQYKEAAPHLILQAFLQRVVNGGAYISREFATGRKRLDLCVHYAEQKYPIELKIHYGPKTEPDGLRQLAEYMDTLGCGEGWLIIFDRDPNRTWDEKISWRNESATTRTIHVLGC